MNSIKTLTCAILLLNIVEIKALLNHRVPKFFLQ